MTANQPRTLRVNRRADSPGWVVELDGHDVSQALTGLSLRLDGSPLAVARLDVIAEDVSTHAEVLAYLPDATKDLLVRLGWTPPAEEATS